MYKIITSLSFLALVSCNDLANKVDSQKQANSESHSNNSTENKPTLSTELVSNSNTAQKNANKKIGPQFSFESELHDFGQLVDGEKVSYSFKFTNSGDEPLIISNAKGSCGCTVPNWPKDPIQPGENGTIDVTFNSSGRSGKQKKAITLTANTNPSRKVINITSEVISN